MHPILGERRRLVIYLLAFLLVGLLLVVGLRGGSTWPTAIILFLPLSVAYGFISLSAWYVCRAFPVHANARPGNIVAVHVVAAAVASLMLVSIGLAWAAAVDSLWDIGAAFSRSSERCSSSSARCSSGWPRSSTISSSRSKRRAKPKRGLSS